jgi:hypothetical protein
MARKQNSRRPIKSVRPSHRRPAMKVCVPQWPNGALAHLRIKIGRSLRIAVPLAITAAALAAVAARVDIAGIEQAASSLPVMALVTIPTALTVGTMIASLRLQLIARDIERPMRFRDAVIATTTGALGGALFFSIFGQVLARSAVLSKTGITPSAAIVLTGYERITAALISLALAVAGGLYLFGHIALDPQSGGAELAKLFVAGIGVLASTAAFAWGRAVIAWARVIRRRALLGFARALLLTAFIQGATMIAYVAAARGLAPSIPILDLAAAISIVMFAASVPISFAGWGVREISAVYALGAVQMPTEAALVIAASIGVFSLLSTAVIALFATLLPRPAPMAATSVAAVSRPGFHADRFLVWVLPIGAAMAVFFQVELPVRGGRLNVNLADGLAVFGGGLFALHLVKSAPIARLRYLGIYAAATTLVVLLSFLHGWAGFGLTSWALVNRLLGWGFLLAYFGTGALLAASAGTEGLRRLLRSFAAAGLAVALLDLVLLTARFGGAAIPFEVLGFRLAGLAGNANAFAFQMLMVLAAVLALRGERTTSAAPRRAPGERLRALTIALLGPDLHRRMSHLAGHLPLVIALTALLFAASRAGWGACAAMLAAALWLRMLGFRELIAAVLLSALAALIVTGDLLHIIHSLDDWAAGGRPGSTGGGPAGALVAHLKTAMPTAAEHDNVDHVQTVLLGLKMWMAHPFFGAGLGAFIESFSREHGRALVIHSTPVWLLAETGLIGFIVFAAPFVAILKGELDQRAKRDLAGRVIVLALVGFAVMGAAHDLMYQRTLWLLLGAALFVGASSRQLEVQQIM